MHQLNKRGQVATEFMLYTSVFIIIAIVAFLVVSDLQKTEIPLQQNKAVKEAGDEFVNILTLSVKGGEGFSYKYNFPKTIFNVPYTVDLSNLNAPKPVVVIEWEGSYGNFSYQYYVPIYKYNTTGACLSAEKLYSDQCSNVLTLINDGENLTIIQT
ncbi:Uncharacterised protein [Candidatus Bilamarchaeum dharawalense]|uniref:Class III signal peptide n=1 Tax=Candidatus Bilamarchaeum dharawalense TaxID=2885759 RepID=A0A5E4LNC4_9ARCH|nr:Uncharacterised protein [Candidatus Bilamarchaeum dharawalense]